MKTVEAPYRSSHSKPSQHLSRWLSIAPAVMLALVPAGCFKAQTSANGRENSKTVAAQASGRTGLDDYVAKPDTNYSYRMVSRVPGQGYTTFILDMTSQAWLTTNEVDRPVWKHWMTVVRPDNVSSSTSLLLIGGGRNGSNPPKAADAATIQIAVATKSVVTELKMIPNQPLIFAGETEGRVEDSLIAYTWDKFLRTGDDKWPARLPMTKAAVRAMDTVTSFCGSAEGGNIKVDQFVVAGGSKRGWTTWTAAAVDKRVVGVVPVVIDVLNIEPSMLHHFGAYGFWAPAIGDYEAFHIMDWNGTPQYRTLMQIVEPFSYRARYTMPKFIINSAGDQFFLPDSSQFYFNDLPGTKYLRYVPNSDHSLKGSDAYETLTACYNAVLYNQPLPQFSWDLLGEDSIRVNTKDKPAKVLLWQATNPDARDFRLEKLGPAYQSSPLAEQTPGVYVANVPKPAKGWTAFFVELTFPSSLQVPFKFTTQVRVVPDLLPYKFVPKGPPAAK